MANYIILDLEMCKVPGYLKTKEYRLKNEIIQIGAVKLNEAFEEVSRFSTFVKPHYGFVDTFIKDLTGITRANVSAAAELEDALKEFLNWIGADEAICVSWSMSDKYQIKKECEAKGIVNERLDEFFESWIDSQKIFTDKVRTGRVWNLTEAINASGIDPEGHAHDGLMDAVNTAALFRKLMTEEDFRMAEAYERVRYGESDERLCFSIGEMLEKLQIA